MGVQNEFYMGKIEKTYTHNYLTYTHMYMSTYVPIECECVKTYTIYNTVVRRTHEQLKAFTCETCGEICDEERLMRCHVLSIHPPAGYRSNGTEYATCLTCDDILHFDTMGLHTTLHHAFTFIGRDPFMCQYCGWSNDFKIGETSCYLTNERNQRANEHLHTQHAL